MLSNGISAPSGLQCSQDSISRSASAKWLYEVLRAHVTEVIVCDPRRNKLLGEGSKTDKVDARKLADLLRTGMLRSVYHGHEPTSLHLSGRNPFPFMRFNRLGPKIHRSVEQLPMKSSKSIL